MVRRKDDAGNIIEDNSSIFFLISMHSLPSKLCSNKLIQLKFLTVVYQLTHVDMCDSCEVVIVVITLSLVGM